MNNFHARASPLKSSQALERDFRAADIQRPQCSAICERLEATIGDGGRPSLART
jgi:hypothetical protein